MREKQQENKRKAIERAKQLPKKGIIDFTNADLLEDPVGRLDEN